MKKNRPVTGLIYRCMRIGLLPLLFVHSFCAVLYAKPMKGQEVLNKKIDLVVHDKEVKNILVDISKKADIKFVYSAQKIPSSAKVSLSMSDQKLGDILDSLFEPLDIKLCF
jgi:type II secretory pathway component GspD/PulD (secretin)